MTFGFKRYRDFRNLMISISSSCASGDMNKYSFSVIFLLGILSAVTFTLLSDLFKFKCWDLHSAKQAYKIFSPLPDDSQIRVIEDGTLGLIIRKDDSVATDYVDKETGKPVYH